MDDDPALPGLLLAMAECGYVVRFSFKGGEWLAECETPRRLAWGKTRYSATIALMQSLGFTMME